MFRPYPEILIREANNEEIPKTIRRESVRLTKNDYVLALGKRNPFERRQKCIDIIKKLWASYPGLGPYPLLDELIRFETNQVFYSKYRDHAAHQLMVFLLGLYIYSHCKPICKKITEEIKASLPSLSEEQFKKEFILRWFVASFIHDIGYVIEDSKADPAKDEKGEDAGLWQLVSTQLNNVLCNCLTQTPVFTAISPKDDTPINEALLEFEGLSPRFALPKNIDLPEKIGMVGSADLLDELDSALHASGIPDNDKPLRTYYKLAHDNTPVGQKRQGFWDHGITSALILLRVWRAYRDKIHAIVKFNNLSKLVLTHYKKNFDDLAKLEGGKVVDDKLCNEESILAAAEAICLHNINKEIWATHSAAFWNEMFPADNYFISLSTEDGTHSPKPLAFLLALVDTLQDWHRPNFKLSLDQGRSSGLIDKDVSIEFDNGANSEQILLYYRDQDEYKKVRNRLLAFLDKEAINQLIVLNTHGSPIFMKDKSFSCYVPPFESYEHNGTHKLAKTGKMELEDDYTLEECLLIEDIDKIFKWGQVDLHEGMFQIKDIRLCPNRKKPCLLRTAPIVTLTELGRCSLALQDTLLVYELLKELKDDLPALCDMIDKSAFDPNYKDLIRMFRNSIMGIPKILNEKLILKDLYGSDCTEGFLKCRIEHSKAEAFYKDFILLKNIAKQNKSLSDFFNHLIEYEIELNNFDCNLGNIILKLDEIIEAQTGKTECEVRRNIKQIKEIEPLSKLYKNINQAFPHLKNEKQRIW